ncbi:MAG TPA: ThuA domain-containing protein [Opitutales bacterium]|nr:ThuA domain-containing protein [Opitutales bacterium]
MKHLVFVLSLVWTLFAGFLHGNEADDSFRVLVFSKTGGFRHASIENGVTAVKELGAANDFAVEAGEDASIFNEKDLDRFQVVVFLNTTGNILDESQKEAFEKFIQEGGGFVGIHAAADTEYDWDWYGRLVGGYFKSHPQVQEAIIDVENRNHPATVHLPEKWKRTDEWYNYRVNPRSRGVQVLMALDTESFSGSEMGDDHPIAWFHEFDGGRAFYTGLGHTPEGFEEEAFRKHLLGAIRWAAGVESATD